LGSGGATDTRRLSALRQRWHDIAAWCVGGSGAAAHACARRSGLRGTEIELERRHMPAGEGAFEHHVHPLTILCTMGVVFWSLAASWARASVAPSRGMRGTNVQMSGVADNTTQLRPRSHPASSHIGRPSVWTTITAPRRARVPVLHAAEHGPPGLSHGADYPCQVKIARAASDSPARPQCCLLHVYSGT